MNVNVGKTKVIKFRRGGRLKNTDLIYYMGEDIEFTNSFEYLGVILTATNKKSAHLNERRRKGINNINALFTKVLIQKLQLQHAHRLFMNIILPSVAYGRSNFTDSLEHAKPVAGYFWKRWSGLSKYQSTSRLLDHIFENDFLNIEKSTGQTCRSIASYYNNGLHNAICKTERC